jgi:hypothetical protein
MNILTTLEKFSKKRKRKEKKKKKIYNNPTKKHNLSNEDIFIYNELNHACDKLTQSIKS